MKFIVAALVFILALSITPKTLATEQAAKTAQPAKSEHNSEKAAHGDKDHKEKLGKTMNSLFPEKQQNTGHTTAPTTVKLTSPKFLAKVSGNSTKLEWSAAAGATAYHVQVATDPNFKWLIANELWVKGTSFEATQLEADKNYYWRVAAVKGENDSMFTKSLFVNSAFTTQK